MLFSLNFEQAACKIIMIFYKGGGSDEQPIELWARKDKARDIASRNGNGVIQLAIRMESADAPSTPVSDPDSALCVRGHSIRISPLSLESNKLPTVHKIA